VKSNIENIIWDIASENAAMYPENFEISNGEFTEEATTNMLVAAKGYFDNRTDSEIERDEDADVTLEDYAEWTKKAISHTILS